MSGFVISIDPAAMASRFAAPQAEEDDDEREEREAREDDDASLGGLRALVNSSNRERMKEFLERIPEREADLLDLYFNKHKRQADIAEIFGVTQAAISYRLDRGLRRLKFLFVIPHVTEEELRRDLPLVPFIQIDVDILVWMWVTTCQSEVASILKLTQGRVRHRFFKARDKLLLAAERDPKFEPYAKLYDHISHNFNILREVQLPQWANRGGNVCT